MYSSDGMDNMDKENTAPAAAADADAAVPEETQTGAPTQDLRLLLDSSSSSTTALHSQSSGEILVEEGLTDRKRSASPLELEKKKMRKVEEEEKDMFDQSDDIQVLTLSTNNNSDSVIVVPDDDNDSKSQSVLDTNQSVEVISVSSDAVQKLSPEPEKKPTVYYGAQPLLESDTLTSDNSGMMMTKLRKSPSGADDEASSLKSSRPISVLTDNISVSPIQHQTTPKEEEEGLFPQRKTSTPGTKLRSPRKKRPEANKRDSSSSSNDEEEEDKTVPDDRFKVPEEVGCAEMVTVLMTVKSLDDLEKLKLDNSCDFFDYCVVKSSNFGMVKEAFNKIKKSTTTQHQKRLSDVSSLSSNSRTTSSSGYLGGDSGTSTISGSSSKRDRHSIMLDLPIEPHKILSPLPQRVPIQQQVISEEVENEAKSGKKTKKKLLKKSERNHGKAGVVTKDDKQPVVVKKSKKDDQENKFGEGTRVFAKWVEKTEVRYWPGKLKKNENEGEEKLLVLFDDGYERLLKQEEVIPVDTLEPGHTVNVCSDEDEGIYNVAVLVCHPDVSDSSVFYTVDFVPIEGLPQVDSRSVPYSQVHLSDGQAKKIMADLGPVWRAKSIVSSTGADISLDNLVDGKRTRCKTPKPTTKVATPRRKKGGDNVDTSLADDTSGCEVGSGAKRTPRKLTFSIKNVPSTTEEESPKKKENKRKKGMRKQVENSLSDYDPTQLFHGLVFLLTQGRHLPQGEEGGFATSGLETETESELDPLDNNLESLTFNKKLLKKIISDHGGSVLDEFPGEKQKQVPSQVIVISDRNCRTMTFLLAIGFGYQRINFVWVHNSVSAKCKLPLKNYLLPVGFSTIDSREVEQHEFQNLRGLFSGLHILIASTSQNFATDWKPLLARLGASVSFRSRGKLDRGLKAVDVVVADSHAPTSIIKDAKEKEVGVVTSEWIVQSLINGKQVGYHNFAV